MAMTPSKAISHVVKSTFLTGRNYTYLIILRKAVIVLLKFLTVLFERNNFGKKDSCKFDKTRKENL